jgi:hypothetical protein
VAQPVRIVHRRSAFERFQQRYVEIDDAAAAAARRRAQSSLDRVEVQRFQLERVTKRREEGVHLQ